MRTTLGALILLTTFTATAQAELNLSGEYRIQNTWGGPSHALYMADLTWNSFGKFAKATVEKNDPCRWTFHRVPAKSNTFWIKSALPGKHKGSYLSWDAGKKKARATVEADDPVEWKLIPVAGRADTYRIINTYPGRFAGAGLSWDPSGEAAIATVEKDDPVEWKISRDLIAHNELYIVNKGGGESHHVYNGFLSWLTRSPNPRVAVKISDPVRWRFEPVPGKSRTYLIKNTFAGKWDGAYLSWSRGSGAHPRIELKKDDPVEWRLDPVSSKRNTYRIVSLYPGDWKGAAVSWSTVGDHGEASLKFDDPVNWEIVGQKPKAAPFRVVFNGIQCLDTTDDGDDEVYLKYSVDGQPWIKIGPRKMDEPNKSVFENIWSGMTKDELNKAFWLGPFSVNAEQTVRIELWEEDGGLNKDDHIGDWLLSRGMSRGHHGRDFKRGGARYRAAATLQSRAGYDPKLPTRYSFLGKDKRLMTDAVGDQGNEGACTAWATTSAIATKILTELLQQDLKNSFMGTESMFDASWFYSQRPNSEKDEGWSIDSALDTAKTVTIPFRVGNGDYGVRVRRWSRIGKVSHMRRALAKGEPLIAGFAVYDDFGAYVGKSGTYAGRITSAERKGRHAVLVTGYHSPPSDRSSYPYWEVQNSWGRQWGRNGRFTIAAGACGIDRTMYRVDEIYVCDRDGNEVKGEEAKYLLAQAAGLSIAGGGAKIDTSKRYRIVSLFPGAFHGAALSWDEADPHPMISVERGDPVEWQLVPAIGKPNCYRIKSTYPGKWKGALISWDHAEPHPKASLEFQDLVDWRFDPVPGKPNVFKIINTSAGKWSGAGLSWDYQDPHPRATLEFKDPVEWELRPVK